jgi:hypothetical protein
MASISSTNTMEGGLLAGGGEQVADPGRAHADEHLQELRAGDGDERHPGLAGDGTSEQRLAGAGRSHEQDPLGDPGADGGEHRGVAQEVDDLADLFFDAVVAGDVGEGGVGALGLGDAGPAARERGGAGELAGGATRHPHQHADDEQ